MSETIHSLKGFDRNLQCRGFQFEPGKSYSLEGKIEACRHGFHACEYPLDVFGYYPPATSRFFEVEQSGDTDRDGGDTKIASAKITIGVELSIADVVARAVKWIFDRAKPEKGASATGVRGAASVTGDRGAASATGVRGAASATGVRGAASVTGYQGAASATGVRGAASATGVRGAASATGDRGAASVTGDQGAASATGKGCVAVAIGEGARAMATETNGICLAHRDDDGKLLALRAGMCGENGIEAGRWYSLTADGRFVEVEEPANA